MARIGYGEAVLKAPLRVLVVAVTVLALSATGLADVLISEIHYHPPGGEANARLEFVELWNTGGDDVDLSGWRLDGTRFTFPVGARIEAGDRLVLAADADAFRAAHGFVADHAYPGKLENSGETLSLEDADGTPIVVVSYDDVAPWSVSPDGLGEWKASHPGCRTLR